MSKQKESERGVRIYFFLILFSMACPFFARIWPVHNLVKNRTMCYLRFFLILYGLVFERGGSDEHTAVTANGPPNRLRFRIQQESVYAKED
jgi:hypothetical protein